MENFTRTRGAERQNGALIKQPISAINKRQRRQPSSLTVFPWQEGARSVQSTKGDCHFLLKPGLKDGFMPVAL